VRAARRPIGWNLHGVPLDEGNEALLAAAQLIPLGARRFPRKDTDAGANLVNPSGRSSCDSRSVGEKLEKFSGPIRNLQISA
jgi:hypothetical protein